MSWRKTKLGNILSESKIESESNDPDRRITVRLNMKGVEKRPFEQGVLGGTKYYVRKAGQFIYGKQNLFKGAFGIIPKELDNYESSLDLPCFDIANDCLPEWVFYYFKQGDFYKSTESISTGTGSRRVQPSRLFEVEIPLPSIKEQKNIIQKCVIAEAEHEKLISEINSQLSNIQLLRQAILQEAVQGKLVPQDSTDEPATELLKRIKAEKAKQAKKGKTETYEPITDAPYAIPDGWVWCRLGEITSLITDGKHGDCRNELDSGYYFLSAKDIKDGELKYDYARQIVYDDFLEVHKRTNLQEGDICMVCTGATVGKIAVATNNPETTKTTFQKSVAVIKIVKPLIDNSYVVNFLKSITPKLLKKSGGSAINNLLLGDLKRIDFPLPPLKEQQRIVAKVQQLIQLCDELEAQVKQSKADAEKLLQAVLREAFEGNKTYKTQDAALSLAAEP